MNPTSQPDESRFVSKEECAECQAQTEYKIEKAYSRGYKDSKRITKIIIKEDRKLIEGARRRGIIEWLTKHKETYWQKPNGEIYLIIRASWTEKEWQALKGGE